MFNKKLNLRVCQRNENGKICVIHEFENLNDFFRAHRNEDTIRTNFVNNPDVRIKGYHCRQRWEFPGITCYGKVLYDENDCLYSVEYLIGLYRIWYKKKIAVFERRRSRNRRKSIRAYLRHMHTAQEIRQSCAVTEDERGVNALPRARRNRHNLPTAWDDKWVNIQRSWKRQSKRRHQWKLK